MTPVQSPSQLVAVHPYCSMNSVLARGVKRALECQSSSTTPRSTRTGAAAATRRGHWSSFWGLVQLVWSGSRRSRECSNRTHYARLDECANRPAKVLDEGPATPPNRTAGRAVHDAVRRPVAIWHHVNRQSIGSHILQCSEHIVGHSQAVS